MIHRLVVVLTLYLLLFLVNITNIQATPALLEIGETTKSLADGEPVTILTAKSYFAFKNFPWNLSSDNTWRVFPNMTIHVRLNLTQYMDISYTVSGAFTGPSHFLTRVIINGQENKLFRQLSGDTLYFTNSKAEKVHLSSNRLHTIQLEYRTPGVVINLNPNSDWGLCYMRAFSY